MRSPIVLVFLLAATSMLSVGAVGAAEKAATDQLPAALKDLGPQQTQIVTVDEAKQVRGQRIWFGIDLIFSNFMSEGYIGAEGSVRNYLNVYVGPYTVFFEAY
jgi:hypothetical protein